MATLKLAKAIDLKLCAPHKLKALADEDSREESCREGDCMILTRERVTREALTGISRAAADLYEAMLLSGYSDRATALGSTTTMVLAIQGLAETALKRIDC